MGWFTASEVRASALQVVTSKTSGMEESPRLGRLASWSLLGEWDRALLADCWCSDKALRWSLVGLEQGSTAPRVALVGRRRRAAEPCHSRSASARVADPITSP